MIRIFFARRHVFSPASYGIRARKLITFPRLGCSVAFWLGWILAFHAGFCQIPFTWLERTEAAEIRSEVTRFIKAAEDGDFDAVQQMLDTGMVPDERDANQKTALMAAAQNGHSEIIKLLIARRADPNARNVRGSTPLMFAAGADVKTLALLLESGADIQARRPDGLNVLYWPVTEGRLDLLRFLVERGADITEQSDLDDTLMHFAASRDRLEILQYLAANGLPIESENRAKKTPLCKASEEGHLSVVQWLVDKGADINHGLEDTNPLYRAIRSGNEEVAFYFISRAQLNKTTLNFALEGAASEGDTRLATALLERGADIEASCVYGRTPLMLAIWAGHEETALMLMEKGANVNARSRDQTTPLMIATEWMDAPELVSKLIGRGADVNAVDESGETALLEACSGKASLAVLQTLMNHGADIRARDKNKHDCLHEVARAHNEQLEKARYLLNRNIPIDTRTVHGLTPLLQAVIRGNFDLVFLLTSKGADIGAFDDDGLTALDHAIREGHLYIVKHLLLLGAKPARPGELELSIELAASRGQEPVISFLLEYARTRKEKSAIADLIDPAEILLGAAAAYRNFEASLAIVKATYPLLTNNVDDIARQALYSACGSRNLPVARFLLEKGTDPNVYRDRNEKGNIALHRAVQAGSTEIVRLLLERHAQVDAVNERGETPLMPAAKAGNAAMVKILLESGAEPRLRNRKGQSAYDLAAELGHQEVVSVLAPVSSIRKARLLWKFLPREKEDHGFTYAMGKPIVNQGTVFVGSRNGWFYALSSKTGEPLWKFLVANDLIEMPAICSHVVCAPAGDGRVYALDTASGRKMWTLEVRPSTDIIAYQAFFLFGKDNDAGSLTELIAVNHATGNIEWKLEVPCATKEPTLDGSMLYFTGRFGDLYGVDLERRSLTYHLQHSEPLSPPLVSEEAIYTFTGDGKVLTASKGEPKILFDTSFGKPIDSPLILFGGTLLLTTRDKIYAMNSKSGKLLWTASSKNKIVARPIVHKGIVYAGMSNPFDEENSDNALVALDADCGRVLWVYEKPDPSHEFKSLSIAGEAILAQDGKNLCAIGTELSLWQRFLSLFR